MCGGIACGFPAGQGTAGSLEMAAWPAGEGARAAAGVCEEGAGPGPSPAQRGGRRAGPGPGLPAAFPRSLPGGSAQDS